MTFVVHCHFIHHLWCNTDNLCHLCYSSESADKIGSLMGKRHPRIIDLVTFVNEWLRHEITCVVQRIVFFCVLRSVYHSLFCKLGVYVMLRVCFGCKEKHKYIITWLALHESEMWLKKVKKKNFKRGIFFTLYGWTAIFYMYYQNVV